MEDYNGNAARAIFARNLNDKMRQMGVTQAELVTKFGITASTVSDWCNGKKYPRIDKIQLLADYFNVTRAELTEEGDIGIPYRTMRRIPILGQVSAGLPLYAETQVEGYIDTEYSGSGEYFALRVKGNSMNAARIFDGDILIVRRQDMVENREIAVVIVGDDEATVKRFSQNGSRITLYPESNDPSFLPQNYNLAETQIRILGKVVENKIKF